MNADERLSAVENRLDRIESLLELNAQQTSEHRELIQDSSRTINQMIDYQASIFRGLAEITQIVKQTNERLGQLTTRVDTLTEQVGGLTERVDSLATSSERHDRILDYLLRRERNGNSED
ncbi:MAG: hypothetical protein F6K19_32160 [Cyanothece sp. SIO1E1]|nr:hypothetical protein [Cyanothece sp. SIO1E1]